MRNWMRWGLSAVLASGLAAGRVSAEQADVKPKGGAAPKANSPDSDPQRPDLWNADRMMEDAVLTISRRYNLNKDQEDYTRSLLVKRTREFLKQYEPELRQLLKESFDLRLGRMQSSADNYKSWASRGMPLFVAAKKEILDGNAEWRSILNDSQKQIHDRDLAQMQESFSQIDRLMGKWSKGDFQPSDLAPQPPPRSVQRPVTANPVNVGQVSPQPPLVVRRAPEELWEIYVRRAGEIYHLTPEQNNAALGILNECRRRAQNYRDSHKAEIDAAEKKIKASNTEAARAEMVEIERPVSEIFQDLRNRIEQIPTKAQRDAVSEAQKAGLVAIEKMQAPSATVRGLPKLPLPVTTRRATQPEQHADNAARPVPAKQPPH